MQQRSDLKLEQLKGVNMIRMKNIAAILALIGSIGAAHASTNLQNDNIQFMGDKNLAEIQGASPDSDEAKRLLIKMKYRVLYKRCKDSGKSGCYHRYVTQNRYKWKK